MLSLIRSPNKVIEPESDLDCKLYLFFFIIDVLGAFGNTKRSLSSMLANVPNALRGMRHLLIMCIIL